MTMLIHTPALDEDWTPERIRVEALLAVSDIVTHDDRSNPETVTAVAAQLVKWVDEATDDTDLRIRMAALRRQHANTSEQTGDTEAFLDGARSYHVFIRTR